MLIKLKLKLATAASYMRKNVLQIPTSYTHKQSYLYTHCIYIWRLFQDFVLRITLLIKNNIYLLATSYERKCHKKHARLWQLKPFVFKNRNHTLFIHAWNHFKSLISKAITSNTIFKNKKIKHNDLTLNTYSTHNWLFT